MNAWLRFDAIWRGLVRAAPARVLEFGAGEGALGAWIATRSDYTGVEPDDRSRAVAERRLARARSEGGRGRVVGSVDDVGDGLFDLICAFEVLEHLEDDVAAMEAWRTRLRPGGWLLASVPAHPHRFAAADRLAGHFRRYSRADMRGHLDAARFTTIRLESYGAGFGHLLEWGRNHLAKRAGHPDDLAERTAASGRLYQPQHAWQRQLSWAVTLPCRALQRPFATTDHGVGWVVLARVAA